MNLSIPRPSLALGAIARSALSFAFVGIITNDFHVKPVYDHSVLILWV